jgi:hypothetical protein
VPSSDRLPSTGPARWFDPKEQEVSVDEAPEVIADLTAMIADEIGDRLHDGTDEQVPQVRDWRQTADDTAKFWFVDGTHVVVTVAMGGQA